MTGRPSTPEAVGPEWAALLRLLPGYDPFRSTGGAWFDAGRAEAAVAFIEGYCTHIEGKLAGKPLTLEPWQRGYVGNLFGWVRRAADGGTVRRYRESLLFVPRKNGKSPLAAAVALYVLFCDGEAGQQNYVAAADREQAGKLFRHCKAMVEAEPEMAGRCEVFGGRAEAGQSKSIVLLRDGSFLQVISADANTKHGGNTHLAIIDELHAQPSRDLVDVLTTSTASENRRQPLTLYLTTADFSRPSICNEVHKRACLARDAAPGGPGDDPAFLPAVYGASKSDDWRDETVWERANPNLDVSVSRDYLRREARKAEDNLPYRSTFLRLHLNVQTDSAEGAVDLLCWDEMGGTVEDDALGGLPCYGGLDLSSKVDPSAFVLVWPFACPDGVVRLVVRCWFWSPADTARQRSRVDRVPYDVWAEQGHLTLTPGSAIDHGVIRADVNAICARFNVRSIGADDYNAVQLLIQLRGDGLPVEKFPQGFYAMSDPTAELLALVGSRRLLHGGGPVLRWMAGNLVVETNSEGKRRPSKGKSTDRVDGMVALIMALGKWLGEETGESVYESRGLLVLGEEARPGQHPTPQPEPAAFDPEDDDTW